MKETTAAFCGHPRNWKIWRAPADDRQQQTTAKVGGRPRTWKILADNRQKQATAKVGRRSRGCEILVCARRRPPILKIKIKMQKKIFNSKLRRSLAGVRHDRGRPNIFWRSSVGCARTRTAEDRWATVRPQWSYSYAGARRGIGGLCVGSQRSSVVVFFSFWQWTQFSQPDFRTGQKMYMYFK